MEFKISSVLNRSLIVLSLLFFSVHANVFAQSIGSPRTFSPIPCGGGASVEYTGPICLNDCYYQNAGVEFIYSGFAGGNFNVELSDSSGSFASPSVLNVSPVAISSSPGRINFNWPTNVAGAGYKLRVKCISPGITGSTTPAFGAYYKLYDTNFWINNRVATANICGGGGYTISVDNPTPSIPSSSPANFPSLRYKWYRGTTLIAGETGTSITVTVGGVYHAELDYGICSTSSSITKSQDITVSIVAAGQTFTVSSSQGTTFCPSTPTILSVTAGYNYQWFQDNVLIPGATSNTYSTGEAGSYHVLVDQGGCSSTSNTIVLTPEDFNASLNIPTNSFIIPGETKIITVTTDAANPTYQWYSGSPLTAIPGETNSSFTTTQAGNYKVVVTQTTGCVSSKDLPFTLEEGTEAIKIPNVISPNNDGTNDFWEIPQEYISASTEVLIINSVGEIVFQTKDYQNNWPNSIIEFKSVNPVFYYIITKEGAAAKKGSITVIK